MADLEVLGQTYVVGQLDARKQFHVVRRLAPVIKSIAPILALANPEAGIDLISATAAVVDGIGALSDVDADYALDTCLGAVRRVQPGVPTPVPVKSVNGAGLMFQDINDSLALQLRLAAAVIMENLSVFFDELQRMLGVDQEITMGSSSPASPQEKTGFLDPVGIPGISVISRN